MAAVELQREILTPEQAADYLQVNRETIYRYIRDGRLVASKLGRAYRIPRRNLDLLLWATRTRDDLALREYSEAEIAGFLELDALDEPATDIMRRINSEADVARDALDRLSDPGGSVRDQLLAAGLLAPKPPMDAPLTDAELEALEAELDAWLDQLPEPLGLAEAVIADREGR